MVVLGQREAMECLIIMKTLRTEKPQRASWYAGGSTCEQQRTPRGFCPVL